MADSRGMRSWSRTDFSWWTGGGTRFVPGSHRAVRCGPGWTLLMCCASVLIQFGCGESQTVNTYYVDEPARQNDGPRDAGATEARLLAAIVPCGDRTWFFKVTGPVDVLDQETETFRQFIESVRFSTGDGSEPEWTMPEGWQRLPASGMRFATLRFGPEPGQLEISVIPLPTVGGADTTYVLRNINLWRKQLGLDPMGEEQLAEQTVRLDLDGATATMVSFIGHVASSNMPPPGHGMGSTGAPLGPGHPPLGQQSPLSYDTPEGWIVGQVGGMRKAAFSVVDGDQTAEITAIDLSSSAGDLLANVNRWREQIQLGPVTQAELDQEVKTIQVGDATGEYVELIGPEDATPREAILGVVLSEPNRTWFFKLKGPAELAERETERFKSFVQSVKIPGAQEVGNGK